MSAFNLTVVRGDTIKFKATITRDGSAVNVSGATFIFTGKRWLSDSSYIFQVNSNDGDIISSNPSSGIVIITLIPEKTSNLVDKIDLHADLEMIETTGVKTTVAKGILTIEPDVTT